MKFFKFLTLREDTYYNLIKLMVFVAVCFIIFHLHKNKKTAEHFIDEQFFSSFIKQNTQDGENLIKFCNVLRNIDNQTEGRRLLKKINGNILEKGENEIKRLLKKINELQNSDEKKQIENSNYYKYKTHVAANNQRKMLNAVKQRLTEDTKTKVNFV